MTLRERIDRLGHWRLFLILLSLIVLGSSVRYTIKTTKPDRFGEQTKSAFLRWRVQIQALEDGQNIYRTHNYPNPPIMAMILWPFTELPPMLGALGWFYAKVVLTILAIRWAFRMIETPERPFPEYAKIAAITCSLHPLLGDLSHGNVNLFILFLVVATVYAFHCGRETLAGVILGLAIACKVTPALFGLYFVCRGSWRAVGGCGAGLLLFLLLLPGAVFGMQNNLEFLHGWYDGMVKPFVVEGKVTSEHPNQSLPGVMYRLLAHEPSFLDYPNEVPVPAAYHNLHDLSLDTIKLLVKGCMGVFALLILLTARPQVLGRDWNRRDATPGWCFMLGCAVVVLGMLLFSERTWKHHGVTLLLPFAVLSYACGTMALTPRDRGRIRWGCALCLLLMWGTGSATLGSRGADLALVYGSHTMIYLILTGLLMRVWWIATVPRENSMPTAKPSSPFPIPQIPATM